MPYSPMDDLRDLRAVFSADVGLTAPERAVLAVLILHRNGDSGRCDPSLTTIGQEAGVDRRTAMRALTKLEADGYVERHQQPFPLRTRYSMDVEPSRGTVPLGAESPQGQRVTQVGAQSHSGRGTVPPERTKERTNKRTQEISEIWEAYQAELDGRSLKLTTGRKRALERLKREQLDQHTDPMALFRAILAAVKASGHHMGNRAYQMPESLFLNEERRERWALAGADRLSGKTGGRANGNGSAAHDPLMMTTAELRR